MRECVCVCLFCLALKVNLEEKAKYFSVCTFYLRLQCALRYDPLDVPSRTKIWESILRHSAADASADIDIGVLADHVLNGRQIKNALQLALALSQHEGVSLQQRHLTETLSITAAFAVDAAEQPSTL